MNVTPAKVAAGISATRNLPLDQGMPVLTRRRHLHFLRPCPLIELKRTCCTQFESGPNAKCQLCRAMSEFKGRAESICSC
jgi:hypothetical protein